MDAAHLQRAIRKFSEERDWIQFHTPKNLAMALSVEASELLEIFQWLTPEESESVMDGPEAKHVREELADITIYLLRLFDVLGVEIGPTVQEKISRNGLRFPVDAVQEHTCVEAPDGRHCRSC